MCLAIIAGSLAPKVTGARAKPSRLHGNTRRLRIEFVLDAATKLRAELVRIGKEGRHHRPGKSFTLKHKYGKPGTYQVVVSVLDDDNGLGTATMDVTIQ